MTLAKAAKALALIGALFLAGCYSSPVVKEDALLPSGGANSGFLLIGAERKWTETDRKDRPLLQLLYQANAGGAGILTVTFQEEADLVLQRLPAGDYVIYNTFFGFKHMVLPGSHFRIVPGQITYAGDFNITVKYPKIGLLTNRTLRVVDNREAAARKLRQQYPVIAGAYAVRSEVTSISASRATLRKRSACTRASRGHVSVQSNAHWNGRAIRSGSSFATGRIGRVLLDARL